MLFLKISISSSAPFASAAFADEAASSSAPTMARKSARSASESERPARSLEGGAEAGLVPGNTRGMEKPGVRKKRMGEAKLSKQEAGRAKRWVFISWRSAVVGR